jgi:hypothetical protein
MAMVRVAPLPVDVSCGLFDGRPRAVRIGGESLPVVSVDRVRREISAFPRSVGPRTVFEVATPSVRLRLGYSHRERRWSVEGIDSEPMELVPAA